MKTVSGWVGVKVKVGTGICESSCEEVMEKVSLCRLKAVVTTVVEVLPCQVRVQGVG